MQQQYNPQGTAQQQYAPQQPQGATQPQPTCPMGQQFDRGQNRCVYNLPGGVTVPGSK
jgi:hypothetical protein